MNVTDYCFEMPYVGNGLRVWFVPAHASFNDWKPLSDSPLVRDTWVAYGGFPFSYPARPHDQCLNPSSVFDQVLQERYNDPEVQGGKIAPIAANSIRVQRPPNFLDRMTTRKQKQVAYNERVLQAEEEIAGINSEVADFLADLNPADAILIAITA
jgi:hypothetical protein